MGQSHGESMPCTFWPRHIVDLIGLILRSWCVARLGMGQRRSSTNSSPAVVLLMSVEDPSSSVRPRPYPTLTESPQQINDEFRHVCEDLRLWSFTESVPTSSGLSSSLVVEKESAVLGLNSPCHSCFYAHTLTKCVPPQDYSRNGSSTSTLIIETSANLILQSTLTT